MSTIHIKVPRYIHDYFASKLGKPCQFERNHVVSSHLRLYLQDESKSTNDAEFVDKAWQQLQCVEGGVNYMWLEIELPHNLDKRQTSLTYIGVRGRRAIAQLLRDIIQKHVWCDMAPIITENANVSATISGWCEVNGICIDDENSIRQMFYRQRDFLMKKGVNLKKRTRIKNN